MLFLQSVMKHADKLKQSGESKVRTMSCFFSYSYACQSLAGIHWGKLFPGALEKRSVLSCWRWLCGVVGMKIEKKLEYSYKV